MTAQNENSLKISEVRKVLTELVERAAYQGQETTITRNGKPMAKIVPTEGAMADFQKLARATVEDSKDILRALE